MDDAYCRDLIAHATRIGATQACIDLIEHTEDIDEISNGRVSQRQQTRNDILLYVAERKAFVAIRLAQSTDLRSEMTASRIRDAVALSGIAETWTATPDMMRLPPLPEDDISRFVDPFDTSPEDARRRKADFERFMQSETSVRAPLLLQNHASVASSKSNAALFARQTIVRHRHRRISATATETSSSGFTRLERSIRAEGKNGVGILRLPEYEQIGYGIDLGMTGREHILDPGTIAPFFAASLSATSAPPRDASACVLGSWATCVILHETIHQSPYYLAQTDAVAIDRDRGILQCSSPDSACAAYAIHPTAPDSPSLADLLPRLADGTLYFDAPTRILRRRDTSLEITFTIVRVLRSHSWHDAFLPATVRIMPADFWKNVTAAFEPVGRILMKCTQNSPLFQAPGIVVSAPPQMI